MWRSLETPMEPPVINASRRDILKAMGFSVAALATPAVAKELMDILEPPRKIGFDYDPLNPLHIPPEAMHLDDWEWKWVRISLMGEDEPISYLARIHDQGWRAVKKDVDFVKEHYYGPYEHVEVGGLKLMARRRRPTVHQPTAEEILTAKYRDYDEAIDGTKLARHLQIG